MSEDHGAEDPGNDKDHLSVNRRRFVKALGVAGGTTVFGIGPVAAESNIPPQQIVEQRQEINRKYNDITTVRGAIDKHASEFLKNLAVKGFLDKPLNSEIESMEFTTPKDAKQTGKGVSVSLSPTSGKEATADITIYKKTREGDMQIHINPETGRNFAMRESESEEYTPIYETEDGVSTADICGPDRHVCKGINSCGAGPPIATSPDHYLVRHCDSGCYYYHVDCCPGWARNCANKRICECRGETDPLW